MKKKTGSTDPLPSFFPVQLQAQITATQVFPAFWWNYFVISPLETATPDYHSAHRLCETLKRAPESEIALVQCETSMDQFLPLVKAWAQDEIYRHRMPPSSKLRQAMNQSLSEASLPLSDSNILNLFRNDPFGTWREVAQKAERRMPIRFTLTRGFLNDSRTGRIIIPVQFAFSPDETARTRKILDLTESPVLIGAHGATLENESQIRTDMRIVGIAGALILGTFAIFLIRLRMMRLIPLFIVVLLGIGFSAILTRQVFGSIHGLTLSFGAAIAGLAMDYAFQAALNFNSPAIWKTNFCGLCTTLVGLLVVMFSSVPLLRQMMFFSACGIAGSYLLFYFIFTRTRAGAWFAIEPRPFVPKTYSFQAPLTAALVGFGMIGIFFAHPEFDLRHFNYQTPAEKELGQWLYETTQPKTPIFQLHSQNDFTAFENEKIWAQKEGVTLENRAEYLPDPATGSQNEMDWKLRMPVFLSTLNQNESKFFSPYFSELKFQALAATKVPLYVQHLFTQNLKQHEWISIWLPISDSEIQKIKSQFPETHALTEIVSVFPKLLFREIGLMVPLSISLALLFHFIYYRRLTYAAIALLPFFTGLGLILLCSFVFHFSLSFVSVIALILVFGFSLDYGIFATDACLRPAEKGMWSGISLAALSTLTGFIPLMFCKHPVLRDLGLTLFLGGTGTYLGAIWAVPAASRWVKKLRMTM